MARNVEKWLVKKTMHLGPIRDMIREGQIIEWDLDRGEIKLHGQLLDGKGVDAPMAMQMLKVLLKKNPEDPCIVPVQDGEESNVSAGEQTTGDV